MFKRVILVALVIGLALFLALPMVAYAVVPTVSTVAATGVTSITATLRGEVTDDDGKTIDERGFEWDIDQSGEPYTYSWTETGSWGNGTFLHHLSGLESGTTYYYRAKAHNSDGWGYGSEMTFVTSPGTAYESHTTGDSTQASAYGVNWYGQTFTTGSAGHTVSQVNVRIYRLGEPGTITLSIRDTDTDGLPTGTDLSSATVNGNAISTNATWVGFDVTDYSLSATETYAIVVRAVGGDSLNYVAWRYDAADGYADGKYVSSANSGSTWTADSGKDFMFEVWGNPTLEVIDAKVFSSVSQDGDWYFAVHYMCTQSPGYPGGVPEQHFNLQLVVGGSVVAQTKVRQWGYMPGSIYISPDVAGELAWGGNYTVRIEGNPQKYATPLPSDDLDLVGTDWIGPELFWLDEWVIDTAELMESYYDETLTLSAIGGESLPSPILNRLGGEIFMEGMPGLETLRPHLFWVIVYGPEWDEEDWTHEMEDTTNWEDRLSTEGSSGQIPSLINELGGLVNLSGRWVGGIGIVGLCVLILGVMATGARPIQGSVALGLMSLVLTLGIWVGLVAVAAVALAITAIVFFMVWVIWLRGT